MPWKTWLAHKLGLQGHLDHETAMTHFNAGLAEGRRLILASLKITPPVPVRINTPPPVVHTPRGHYFKACYQQFLPDAPTVESPSMQRHAGIRAWERHRHP